jgi:hypothetical protein
LLTGPQLSEWQAFDKMDPIGSWRDDFRIAKLESLIINIVNQLYHKEGTEPLITTATDFMVKWGEEDEPPEPKKQSQEELKQMLLGFAKEHNKRDKRIGIQSKVPKRNTDKFQGR